MRIERFDPQIVWVAVVAASVLGVICAGVGLSGDPCGDGTRLVGIYVAAVLFGTAAMLLTMASTRWWIAAAAGIAVMTASGAGLLFLNFTRWVSGCTN